MNLNHARATISTHTPDQTTVDWRALYQAQTKAYQRALRLLGQTLPPGPLSRELRTRIEILLHQAGDDT